MLRCPRQRKECALKTTDDQHELFVVVDTKDRIVGYRTRFACHHDRTLIHRTAGVAVFKGNSMLLQKRSDSKDMEPGRWCIAAAGHVAKGESTKEAAIRELEEEIGVKAKELVFRKKFIVRATRETEMTSLYSFEYAGPFRPKKEEVAEVRFVSKKELKEELRTGNMQLTEAALETLKQIHFV